MKFNIKFIIITLVLTLVIIPVLFNIFFLWDSGLSRGGTSDWFTLYGNIFGGLIGGFFTYLALLLTLNDQKENKKQEMRPRIDISHQSIDFTDLMNDTLNFDPIVIELNNIGGSICKNIEITLSLQKYEEVLSALNQSKTTLKIELLHANTVRIVDIPDIENKRVKSVHFFTVDEEGSRKMSLGAVYEKYNAEFIGTCTPLVLNHEAKAKYILQMNVKNMINYIVKNRSYTGVGYKKEEKPPLLGDLILNYRFLLV